MEVNTYIIENFYSNPDEVREFALQQDFKIRGNYPGQRTEPFLNESITNTIESVMFPKWGKVTDWGSEYTGAYQYTTAVERSWIHSDHNTRWAGICYLTPNAPLGAGTGLFKHKSTGLISHPYKSNGIPDKELMDEIYKDSQDYTKWEMSDRFANVYNRLVIYRGDFFHQSLDYFGRDKYDGRLFQTFFFNTER